MQQTDVLVPVFSDQNGIPVISIYREDCDSGTFVRVPGEPLRLFRDNIEGLGKQVGELVSARYDREERQWRSPTVIVNRLRAFSYYRFMRDGFMRREIHVASADSLHGRIMRLQMYQLGFKGSASMQTRQLFARRFMQALRLCADEALACLKEAV